MEYHKVYKPFERLTVRIGCISRQNQSMGMGGSSLVKLSGKKGSRMTKLPYGPNGMMGERSEDNIFYYFWGGGIIIRRKPKVGGEVAAAY